MISGFEINVRNFMDHGWSRNKSLMVTSGLIFIMGIPASIIVLEGGVPAYLKNQDHVWSFGLIVSGMFVFFAVWKFGINHFRETLVNAQYNDLYIGRWWVYIMYLFPLQFLVLMVWFFSQSIALHPNSWWNPFEPEGFATIVLQWGLALAILIKLNDWINKRPLIPQQAESEEPLEVQSEQYYYPTKGDYRGD